MLYIFVGENDIPTEAQNLGTLRGKILRINPTEQFPLTIRLSARSQRLFPLSIASAIATASASRSIPIRMTYGRQKTVRTTNDQINRIIAGKNYGWPICSGICNNPLYIDPIITFNPCSLRQPGSSQSEKIPSIRRSITTTYCSPISHVGQLHRIVLGGVALTDFSSHTIDCNCGQGGLLAVMHGLNVPGQDGYIYVSNSSGRIFRVVLQYSP